MVEAEASDGGEGWRCSSVDVAMMLKAGDVVLLCPEATRKEYGCDLMSGDGEPLRLDGRVISVQGNWATVLINRVFSVSRFTAPLSGVSLTLPVSWIEEVVDYEATLWPMSGVDAIKAARARDSAQKAEATSPALYWEEWEEGGAGTAPTVPIAAPSQRD